LQYLIEYKYYVSDSSFFYVYGFDLFQKVNESKTFYHHGCFINKQMFIQVDILFIK